jgi:formate-nitrite transporter family protein
LAIAALVRHTAIFDTNVRKTFTEMGVAAIAAGPFTIFLRAIFAGWLIALTVWMLPAVEASRPAIIILLTYLIALGRFSHVIAGSVEVLYSVTSNGGVSWNRYVVNFLLPALSGNIAGGDLWLHCLIMLKL